MKRLGFAAQGRSHLACSGIVKWSLPGLIPPGYEGPTPGVANGSRTRDMEVTEVVEAELLLLDCATGRTYPCVIEGSSSGERAILGLSCVGLEDVAAEG